MSLGEFKGLEFCLPDGTEARVDGLKIGYDISVVTASGERRTLRSTVDTMDKKLRGTVEMFNGGGSPISHEDMDSEDLRGTLSDVLYWLMNAELPDCDN